MRSARLKKKENSNNNSSSFFNQEPAAADHYEKEADAMGKNVVHRSNASATIQRFGASEHKLLGDSTGVMIDIGGGIQLSFGDIIALAGDEFGSPEELFDSTKTESGRAKIRAH